MPLADDSLNWWNNAPNKQTYTTAKFHHTTLKERSHLATNDNNVYSILKLAAAGKGPVKLVTVKSIRSR
jgi:hypothetical protein